MAFQEVTPPFVRAVQETEWLKQKHWISAVDHNNLGTVLISRVQPATVTWTELPTKMGRRLLTADFPMGLRVGVCHLESLANDALRKEQMRKAFATLKQSPKSVMLGDFNFPDGAPEATCVDPDFSDAWPAAHPGSAGHTRDTVANPMGRFRRDDKKERLDRILLRGVKLRSIDLMGMEPIKPGLYPSDHFGLLARISL